MSAYTATSPQGRILLALRAGDTESHVLYERFPFFGSVLGELVRQRLIAKHGDEYRLTPAGRAACPLRNQPKVPKPAVPAKTETIQEYIMPKGTKQPFDQAEFLATIRAAGPAGITRKELVRIYSEVVCESVVDRWIRRIRAAVPAVVRVPKFGVLAAIDVTRPSLEEEVAKIEAEFAGFSAPDDLAESARGAAGRDAEIPCDELLDFDLTPQPAAGPFPAEPAIADERSAYELPAEIVITNPDGVNFAIWSNGALTIEEADSSIRLSARVTAKLRAYLGLFKGEA